MLWDKDDQTMPYTPHDSHTINYTMATVDVFEKKNVNLLKYLKYHRITFPTMHLSPVTYFLHIILVLSAIF
jgi:hypothetical protein